MPKGWAGFESSWEPDTLNLLNVEFNMNGYGMHNPMQEDNVWMTGPDGNPIYSYRTDLRFLEQTVQADWSRPYGSHHKLDIGGKAIFRNNHSVSDYIYHPAWNTHDDFTHRTTIGAAYADYCFTIGKWSLRAGLRYEYSYLSARFNDRDAAGKDARQARGESARVGRNNVLPLTS